jgi:hypothetical protein
VAHEFQRPQVLIAGKKESIVRRIGEGLGDKPETGEDRHGGNVEYSHVSWLDMSVSR